MKVSDQFGDLIAPRANRYILHSDYNNPMMKSLELLKVNDFDPRLFVISGLHMMDNFKYEDPNFRDEKLKLVQKQLSAQKSSTLTHFEMASYIDIDNLLGIQKYIIPSVDSIGMNEQEVENLLTLLEQGKISISADSNPRGESILHYYCFFTFIFRSRIYWRVKYIERLIKYHISAKK